MAACSGPHPDPARSCPPRLGAALGLPGGVAAALATALLGRDPAVGLVLATVVAAAIAARTTAPGAAVAAWLCWACWDGFVLHRMGTLGGSPDDLRALALVVSVGLAICGARAALRPGYPAPARRILAHPR